MEYVLLIIFFFAILWLTAKILFSHEGERVSLSEISDKAIIDYNKAKKVILTMYERSKSGNKSVTFTTSYPSQDAYMKNIEYIKEMIKENFTDDIKVDVEALEYKGTVEVTIITSWE